METQKLTQKHYPKFIASKNERGIPDKWHCEEVPRQQREQKSEPMVFAKSQDRR